MKNSRRRFRTVGEAAAYLAELLRWLPHSALQQFDTISKSLPEPAAVRLAHKRLDRWSKSLSKPLGHRHAQRTQRQLVTEFAEFWPESEVAAFSLLVAELERWLEVHLRPREVRNIRRSLRSGIPSARLEILANAVTHVMTVEPLTEVERHSLGHILIIIAPRRPQRLSELERHLLQVPPKPLVLLRRAVDHERRSPSFRLNSLDVPLYDAHSITENERSDPQTQAEIRELVEQLANAIAALPLPHREVLRARLSGLTHEMVAKLLGLSPSKVYRLYLEGVRLLLQRLPQGLLE